ncbi:MAG: VWA domain-containing protein [Candidatus Micrarchaeia archaeon]|jgi:Ca-activated chloride channel family protein
MDFTFEHSIYLLFLLLIPLLVALHFYSLHFVRQKAMRFANFEALEKIVQARQVVPNNYLILAMRALTLVGFTLAASGITAHYQAQASAYDYIVAMDISNSMQSSDLLPDRLGASKAAVAGWVSALPQGTHVGIVTFSSQANLFAEPTGDLWMAALKTAGIIGDRSGGTAICEALKAGTNWLSSAKNPGAIVLVSDGQNNAGCLLEEGIAYAKGRGVKVYSIGVGSAAGGAVEGLPGTVFTLDEADLRKVADGTGGAYYRASDSDGLKAAFASLVAPGMREESVPLAIPLMMLSFLFVFIDWGLSISRYRAIP